MPQYFKLDFETLGAKVGRMGRLPSTPIQKELLERYHRLQTVVLAHNNHGQHKSAEERQRVETTMTEFHKELCEDIVKYIEVHDALNLSLSRSKVAPEHVYETMVAAFYTLTDRSAKLTFGELKDLDYFFAPAGNTSNPNLARNLYQKKSIGGHSNAVHVLRRTGTNVLVDGVDCYFLNTSTVILVYL